MKRTRIYLAARYSRREELCRYREELEKAGHVVTSRWLNGKHQINDAGTPIGDDGESLVEGQSPEGIKLREMFALEDVTDIKDADTIIAFTEPPRSGASRGGRHVEFGFAMASGMRLMVVGYRENLFCWLPQVEFFSAFEDAAKAL